MTSQPELSVVVTLTSAGPHVDACLAALARQEHAPAFEVLLPVDGSLHDLEPAIERWSALLPALRVIRLPEPTDGPEQPSDAGQRHLLYDRRRAAGLGEARAALVALTEDHARPRPDWCREIVRAHARRSNPAIGGVIDNASINRLAHAAYLCDFGRYQSPREPGPSAFLSDVNVSYKRSELEQVRDQWQPSYHETAVHGALQQRGHTLWLEPAIGVAQQRGPLDWSTSLRERVSWGRLYAGKRCNEITPARRAALAILSPLLPPLLLARQIANAWRSRRRSDWAALPAVTVLLCAWSFGEALGYWTARPV